MDKVCGNHPESLALAVCKACEKAICLMCVLDEREGTFCSDSCVQAFRDGVPVTSAAQAEGAAPAGDPVPAAASTVWEDMPSAEQPGGDPAPRHHEEPPPEEPEAPAPEPRAVPASTKSIGNPCYQHADIRAKAFCAACKRPICGLCIVESPAGMFCSDTCAKGLRGKRGLGAGAKVAVALALVVVAAGVAVAVVPGLLDRVKAMAGLSPDVQPPPPPIAGPPPPPVPGPTPATNPIPVPGPGGTIPKPPPFPVKPPPPPPAPKPPGPPVPRPLPPPAPKFTRPEPPKPTRMLNPWQGEPPGAWYRIQTVEGGKTTLTDIGLKERDAVSYTLQMQDAGGAVRDARTEILPVEILGEERLQIEDRSWTCEVRGVKKADGTYLRSWVLVQSRHAGAVLQEDTPEGRRYPVRLWENPVRVGFRDFDCLVIESEVEASGKRSKAWYSPAYPLGVVKMENDRSRSVLIDAGETWASRPPLK